MESFYTVKQVANIFNCSENTIWRWIREGKLQSTTLANGKTRISQNQISDFTKNGSA